MQPLARRSTAGLGLALIRGGFMIAPLLRPWFLTAASLLVAASAFAQTPPKVGDKVVMPDVRLLDGTLLSASDFAGKPLIVEYWASWCPYCARQNPYFEKLSKAAAGKNLRVLSISIDKDAQAAKDYLSKHGYTFNAAMDSDALLAVFGKRRVIPEVFVVDAQGRLAQVIPGEMFEEDMLELIRFAAPDSAPSRP